MSIPIFRNCSFFYYTRIVFLKVTCYNIANRFHTRKDFFMQTTLTFIRHGQTDWNAQGIIQGTSNVPLNNKGIEQAKQKAPLLKHELFDHAYSSPLSRAKKTMDILLQENNVSLDIITDDRLKERTFGTVEGHHVNLFRNLVSQGITATGYEKNEILEARVFDFMVDIKDKHRTQNIIITAHSHVLKAALVSIDPKTYFYTTPLDNLAICTFIFNHKTNSWSVSYAETGIKKQAINI